MSATGSRPQNKMERFKELNSLSEFSDKLYDLIESLDWLLGKDFPENIKIDGVSHEMEYVIDALKDYLHKVDNNFYKESKVLFKKLQIN